MQQHKRDKAAIGPHEAKQATEQDYNGNNYNNKHAIANDTYSTTTCKGNSKWRGARESGNWSKRSRLASEKEKKVFKGSLKISLRPRVQSLWEHSRNSRISRL